MLVLNEEDMRLATSYSDNMDAVEEAFSLFTTGDYTMPSRLSVPHNGNTMLYMPCFAAGYAGTKILAEWPENPSKGLPYLDGIMLLNNGETGQLEAVLDGNALTALRTGAVGGVVMRHFSKPEVKTVGIIGCGVQGLHQLCYACVTRDIQTAFLYDSKKRDLAPFISALEKMIAPKKVNCVVCRDTESLLKSSEVVITATQATKPVLPNDPEKLRGKLVIAFGSWRPTMREIPDAIWEVVDEVYTELPHACEESGDLSQPLASGLLKMDQVTFMGQYLTDKKQEKTTLPGETVFYKSVGMGIFDVLVAREILRAAKAKHLGQTVTW